MLLLAALAAAASAGAGTGAATAADHPTAPAAPTVALYDDSAHAAGGSWDAGQTALRSLLTGAGLSYEEVDPADVNGGELLTAGYRMLLVGGGWAGGYRRYLSAGAYEDIRQFVADGGVYVGICAGAFLASSVVRWQPDADTVPARYDYPLDLFPGIARGAVLSLMPWTAPTGCGTGIVAGATMTAVEASSARIPALYYGGPLFVGTGDVPLLEVLARYDAPGTAADGEPAIVRFPYGAGWVVLSSPHMELAFSQCRLRVDVDARAFLREVIAETLAR